MDSALEGGVVFGWMDLCNENTQYFHPYGTKDNGGTEAANCGLVLGQDPQNGNNYWAKAYHDGSGGHSRVENAAGTAIFQKDWGAYDTGWAYNTTTAEVHKNSANYPSWGGQVDMFHAQWLDSSGRWNFWSFTNTSDDCPYHASWFSADAWQAQSSC